MAVAFDAVGPSAAGAGNAGTSPLTWTHTCGASATALYVGVGVGVGVPGTDSHLTITATYNGVAMTALSAGQSSGFTGITGNSGMVKVFVLTSPPTGSAYTVSVAVTPGSGNTLNSIAGGSISVTGSATTGTPVQGFAQNVGSGSIGVTGTTSGNLCLAYVADGTGGEAWTAGTQRFRIDNSTSSAAGAVTGATLAAAGGTTTMSWTMTSDYYGAIAFEAQSGAPVTTAPAGAATAAGAAPAPSLVKGGMVPAGLAAATGTAPAAVAKVPTQAPAGLAAATGTAPAPSTGKRYIAGLSGSGYTAYFADQGGSPRFWLMEMAWGLPCNAGRWNGTGGGTWQSDMDTYFAKRASQGYTAWWGCPWINSSMAGNAGLAFQDGRTWDNIYPLTVNGTPGPIVTGSETIALNNPFWTRTDYLINSALAQGIAVFLNLGQKYDWDSGGIWLHVSTTQAQAFGTAVATRYPQATYPNLHWVFGDDSSGLQESYYTSMLTGIRNAGDTRGVISIEQMPECNSHVQFNNGSAFVAGGFGITKATFNLCYTYGATPYLALEASYNETGTTAIPPVWGDGIWYADVGTHTNDRTERRMVWWSLASGARGVDVTSGPSQTQGNLWTWQSTAVSLLTTDTNGPFCTATIGTIVSYFTSLPGWHQLVADYGSALVTAGRGTRATSPAPGFNTRNYGDSDNYVCASRTASGSLAVIYGTAAFSITINQAQMAAGYTATWVDPATCATTPATAGATYNSGTKGNNSAGNPDWVLVLAAPAGTTAAAGLAAAAGTAPAPAAVTGAGGNVTRVNTASITANSASSPATITIPAGTGIAAGDLIVIATNALGVASPAVTVKDSVNNVNFTQLRQDQASSSANRYGTSFYFRTPQAIPDGSAITVTSAGVTQIGGAVDVFRGCSGVIDKGPAGQANATSSTSCAAPALPANATAGALVVTAACANSTASSFTAGAPFTTGSHDTVCCAAIGYVLSASGSGTYASTWTIGSSTSAGQTVSFAAGATATADLAAAYADALLPVLSVTTAPQAGTTVVIGPGGGGTWVNPGNALADDGATATWTVP